MTTVSTFPGSGCEVSIYLLQCISFFNLFRAEKAEVRSRWFLSAAQGSRSGIDPIPESCRMDSGSILGTCSGSCNLKGLP